MGTISSPQLSARPFRLDTALSAGELSETVSSALFSVEGSDSPSGFGSTLDSTEYIDLRPNPRMRVRPPEVIPAGDGRPTRLRVRYYWTRTDSRARRQNDSSDDWRVTHVLQAADVLLYAQPEGGFSGLVTTRTPRDFQRVLAALQVQLEVDDESASITTDVIPERLGGDFFLWLFYREQTSKVLGTSGLKLIEVTALSSLNRNKGARFRDGATLERIELVSLIATSEGQFGPAKFSINSSDPAAGFDLELHPDGGFQPLRTSDYIEEDVPRDEQGPRLFDDLWISVLPALRSEYAADSDWADRGRSALRDMCLAAVQTALESALAISAADAPNAG